MSVQLFGSHPDGREVHRVLLRNDNVEVGLLTFGATVQSLTFNDAPMIVGSDMLSDYLGLLQYSGAIVGRVANRIANAKAEIDGQQFAFDANEASGNCLHGGRDGASSLIWQITETSAQHVVFELTLPDGHMGFPGNLDVQVRYELRDQTFVLEISAKSDANTLCSFAPHTYWNLSGEPDINGHDLKIAAKEYLPLNANAIPTGEIANVSGTDFDFSEMRNLAGAELDHNFCLSNQRQELRPILWLKSERSSVALEVASTEAGVQVYDARHFNRKGIAIEPQIWPDAINQTGFPSMALNVGDTYRTTTEFKLSKRTHS